MQNLTKTDEFYPILTQAYSASNSYDCLHTGSIQTKFNMVKGFRSGQIYLEAIFQFNLDR